MKYSVKRKLITEFMPILGCIFVTVLFLIACIRDDWNSFRTEPSFRLFLGVIFIITAVAIYHYMKFFLSYWKSLNFYKDERFNIFRENGFELSEEYFKVENKYEFFFSFLGKYQGYNFQIFTSYFIDEDELEMTTREQVNYIAFYAFSENIEEEMEDYDREVALRENYKNCSFGDHQAILSSSMNFNDDFFVNLDRLVSILRTEQLYPLTYEEALKLNGYSNRKEV